MRNDGALPAFDPELFARARAELGVTWGRPLRHFAETSSTNDRALDECDSAMKTGGVFVAESQTGGRGRRGNAWYSASGENLTFSVLLRLPIPPEKTATLALIVGLALRAAITLALVAGKRPETARVKWPNDVLVEGRKLAGILVETRVRGAETTAIVGVGLNVEQREFPEAAGRPTSLALLEVPAEHRGRERLLALFLGELESRIGPWLARGFAASVDEFRRYDALVGRRIVVDEKRGTARGVSEHGALFLEGEDGSLATISAGHVTFAEGALNPD